MIGLNGTRLMFEPDHWRALACGESLAQWLRSAPDGNVYMLPAGDRLKAAMELVAAVSDVHAAGVTHNDIKPDNCLRSATGEFKLADLGLGVRMKAADRGADNQYSMTTFAGRPPCD